jgi:hypothetical protein
MAARTIQINSFCGGTSKLMDSEFIGMEETVNMYPETVSAQDSYTTRMLKSVEGFSYVSHADDWRGDLLVIAGVPANPTVNEESLLLITDAGAEFDAYTLWNGVLKQVGSPSMSVVSDPKTISLSNGLTLFLNDGEIFAIDPTTESTSTIPKITLPDSFSHAGKISPTEMAQLNYRVILNDSGTDYIYWSEINRPSGSTDTHAFEQTLTRYAYTKLDGTSVTFADNVYYPPAEGTYTGALSSETVSVSSLNSMRMDFKADSVTALCATDSSLFVFGQGSLQVLAWQNSTIAPFAIVSKTSSVGLDLPKTAVVIDRECYFVGKGVGGLLGVWAVNESGQLRKVSTNSEDQRIAAKAKGLNAVALSYSYKGHTFYVLTFGNVGHETIVYDITEGLWSDRACFDSQGNRRPWNVDSCVMIKGKPVFLAENERAETHSLLEFDPDSNTDYFKVAPFEGSPIERIRTTGIKYDGVNDIMVTGLEIIMNNGSTKVLEEQQPGYNPRVMLQVSVDGGRTWSNELWAYAGRTGQYSWRTRWNGLGRGARFAFRVKMAEPVAFEIATAYLTFIPCGNRI